MRAVLSRRSLQLVAPVALLLLPGAGGLAAQAQPAPSARPMPAARPADVASVDAIVAALYDVISGPAGQQRDWDRMRSLFIPGARLIPTGPRPEGGVGYRVLDLEGWIAGAEGWLMTNGFFEREIARKADRYGNIVHLFSTYDSRYKAEDPAPFARGINSIQLVFDGTRWWVVTVFWQGESADHPIPAEYLPGR